MIKDNLGVEFRVGDTVVVSAWGAPVRLTDTGRRATVIGFTPAGNVRLDGAPFGHAHDPIAGGRAVRPGCLIVARRDGASGYEGNRPACLTCGDPLDRPTGAGRSAACAATHRSAR